MKNLNQLIEIAQNIVVSGKGILAADESTPTIAKRFAAHDIPNSEENRLSYRSALFTTEGLSQYISGTILFDETIRQSVGDTPIPKLISDAGLIPGIKVDGGLRDLPGFPGEKFTQGLDELLPRMEEYRELGARFSKWRAVVAIGEGLPTHTAVETAAHTLAMFAALSQEAGLVPIVEPEILMNGDHTIERCQEMSEDALLAVFSELAAHRVNLEGMLLKTGMILSGQDCNVQADTETIAERTLECMRRTVPAAVPGILFLSGGQSEIEATERLNAICQTKDVPWALSISFGRALQATALKTWGGNTDNIPAAQSALLHRAKCNSLAMLGKYSTEVEAGASS
jgi:fructose-bisphosphate aldolase class I